MMNRTRWTGVLVTALATTTAPAWAQTAGAGAPATPPATPPAAGAGDADTYFREGNEHFKQKKWADAEAAYEQAFRLRKAHDIAASLGDTELNQGKHREAAEHLSFAVRTWPATGYYAYKKRDVEQRLAQAKREVATLRIKVNVDDAKVLIDGAQVGTSPLGAEVFVEAGERSVEARAEKHWADSESIKAKKGAEQEVVLTLHEMPNGGAEDPDRYFRYGNHLYKKKRWADAEAIFEKAFQHKKAHDIAANLGYAELNQGKHREAAEHLSFAVRNWAPTGKEDKKRFAEERLAQAKKEVATLQIKVSVAEAEVLIDGASMGKSPLASEVYVEPGTRTVEARRAGYFPAREIVQAKKGAALGVDLSPEEIPIRSKELVIAGGAVAGAALVAGVVLTVVANGKAAEWRELDPSESCYTRGSPANLPGDCDRVDSLRHGAADLGSAAVWSFIGAGLVGGATLTYVVVTGRSRPVLDERSGVRVAPALGSTGGGVWISGRW